MSDSISPMITEKEAVLRERAAFAKGAWTYVATTFADAEHGAERLYPLPKITRPREEVFGGLKYLVRDGCLMMIYTGGPVPLSSGLGAIKTIGDAKRLLALFDNPLETIEDSTP